MRRVSVAVMLMVVLLTTAMAASEQFRLGVLNAVINTYDRYTELTFKGEDEVAPRDPTPEEAEQNEDWTYYYGVGFEWIPEGYEVGDDGWSRTNGTRGLSLYDGAGHAIDVDVIRYSGGYSQQIEFRGFIRDQFGNSGISSDTIHKRSQSILQSNPVLDR